MARSNPLAHNCIGTCIVNSTTYRLQCLRVQAYKKPSKHDDKDDEPATRICQRIQGESSSCTHRLKALLLTTLASFSPALAYHRKKLCFAASPSVLKLSALCFASNLRRASRTQTLRPSPKPQPLSRVQALPVVAAARAAHAFVAQL